VRLAHGQAEVIADERQVEALAVVGHEQAVVEDVVAEVEEVLAVEAAGLGLVMNAMSRISLPHPGQARLLPLMILCPGEACRSDLDRPILFAAMLWKSRGGGEIFRDGWPRTDLS